MNRSDVLTAAGMGAMAGMRALSAPTVMSQQMAEDGTPVQASPVEEILSSPTTARVLPLLALGEFVLDKIPGISERIASPALVMRVASGLLMGVAVARQKKVPVVGLAVVGAAAALASSFVLFKARQFATERLRIPNILAGFIEDALVTSAGVRLSAAIG